MQELAAQHWQAVLERLSTQMGEKSFETWFSHVEVLHFDAERVELGVANRFIGGWLRDHYLATIRDAISEVHGFAPDVGFTVSTRPFKEMRRQQEEEMPSPAAPRPRAGTTLSLNDEFRLEEFVVGPSNRLAHAACVAAVENLATVYNPIFIYSGSGLGKTHLLQGVCHAAQERRPGLAVEYVACEDFVNAYICAINTRRFEEFRARYRRVKLLVVDDVHFLNSKEKMQGEFLHTFDAVRNCGGQIVLSSDAHVNEITSLQKRLVTRFAQGLVAQIARPEFETRLAILRHKAAKRGWRFSDEVFEIVAHQVDSSVRELEGAMKAIRILAECEGREPDAALARKALRGLATSNDGPVTIAEIVRLVEAEFGVAASDLRSRRRTPKVLLPRQVAMFVARHATDQSLAEIGGHFGGRDHATVVHSEKRIRSRLAADEALRGKVEKVFRALGRPLPGVS